ncbi:MAG TPA: hypothetical protein VK624_12375 [Steroidobacteraceae bacterium]|jgi:hypothetical protein|nr:hypothetical protein [Steroidobacteraceae bacterium]
MFPSAGAGTISTVPSTSTATVTITGIELAHRIRNRQFMLSRTYRRLGKWSLKKESPIALA